MESFCLITFYTTHDVLKAEKVLMNSNLKIELIPVPREFSANCGISMCLPWEKKDNAVDILKNNSIQIENVHQWNRN